LSTRYPEAHVRPSRRYGGAIMSRSFACYLVATGVAAGIVMICPGIVILGLSFGILLGVFFGFAPSLFLYSVLWWSARWLLLRMLAGTPVVSTRFPRIVVGAAAAIVAVPAR
jgi:hypothetical protein